ncbi:hypothetical protein ACE193_22490 [Bernardetia sp. OM2101]|uniref:hypothetical protein n=1 Tax=Bernardetia sp. OM2101 TaxID=3344876 RepID=UPI0035D0C799
MENVLDFEDKPEEKGSWKPVLITNGVLIIGFLIIGYLLFLQVASFSIPIVSIVINVLRNLCFLLIIVNTLCVFISLIFFKNYWKKWLVMACFGVILFIAVISIIFILDISKIL